MKLRDLHVKEIAVRESCLVLSRIFLCAYLRDYEEKKIETWQMRFGGIYLKKSAIKIEAMRIYALSIARESEY